jgi:predicted Zn-dependent protease
MEKLYPASYYDGKTTNKHAVLISFNPDGISIHKNHFQEIPSVILWEQQQIDLLEQNSTQLSLRYGSSFPYEQLDISDKEFISAFRHSKIKIKSYRKSLFIAGIIVFLITSVWLAYMYLLPAAIDKIAMKVPISYEEKLGKNVLENLLLNAKVDSAKSEYLNAFFKQLNIESEYQIKIFYIEDKLVNAFALPGGYILVYEGLAKKLKNEAQLAALLSHEYTHIAKRHSTRNVFRHLTGYILLSVITGDMNGVTQQILLNAQRLYELSYNREMEHEADVVGLELMKSNQINANGMKGLFKVLKTESYMNPPEILSTHPDIENRIQTVNDFIANNPYQTIKNDSLVYYFNQIKK